MQAIHKDLLWLGNALDIREPKRLFELEICAVVDLAYEEPPAVLPRSLIYCRFPLNDGGGNERSLLTLAVQTVVDLLAAETRTAIACSAGMSRSPSIATLALAAHLSEQPEDIVARIATLRTLEINPMLWSDVRAVFTAVRRNT